MFLKLFPRYAGRARRGATVAGDHLRGTAVVVENAPKSLSRHDGASVIRACRQRCEELVAETLVVPFCVIVHYVFGYRCAQVSLTERYEAVETLSHVWRERIFPHMRSDSDYWREGAGCPFHKLELREISELPATRMLWSKWLCLLFIHPRAPNLINLRYAGTMPA